MVFGAVRKGFLAHLEYLCIMFFNAGQSKWARINNRTLTVHKYLNLFHLYPCCRCWNPWIRSLLDLWLNTTSLHRLLAKNKFHGNLYKITKFPCKQICGQYHSHTTVFKCDFWLKHGKAPKTTTALVAMVKAKRTEGVYSHPTQTIIRYTQNKKLSQRALAIPTPSSLGGGMNRNSVVELGERLLPAGFQTHLNHFQMKWGVFSF